MRAWKLFLLLIGAVLIAVGLYGVRLIMAFLSAASVAENFRSTCASERGAPECSTQRFPAGTPHVGQGTEDNCVGVSSFFFIGTECDKAQPQNRPI